MTPSFLGTIKEGRLLVDKAPLLRQHLHTLEGKRIELTVDRLKRTRTGNQNRYYWGIIVAAIAKHTGHDPEQIHEALKQMWSPKWYLDPHPPTRQTLGIPTSTTMLDTIQFVEYTEKCRMWANEFLGLQIPLPGEVTV